jgi:HK97 family phage portal protein
MGLLSRRRAEDRALKTPELPTGLQIWSTPEITTDPQGRQALRVADVWGCVRLLADTISTLPVEVYRDLPTGRQEVGPDARISQLLARPAPGSTLPDLIGQIVLSMSLFGEAFVAKYVGGDGQISQLGVISPEVVSVRLNGGVMIYTVTSVTQGVVDVGPADLLHIKSSMTTADGLRGLSPIATCRMAVSGNAALAASSKAFVDAGSRPSGILKVAGAGSDYVVQQLSETWNAAHGGSANAGKVAVVSGDVAFQQLGLSSADAQFIESRELSTREICRIFNVPPWLIGGVVAGRTLVYSTTQEQAKSLVTYSLRPIIARIEAAISQDPTLCPGGTIVRFSLDELLRADPVSRAAFYTAALNPATGWLSRDEVRELEGLGPEEPGTEADDAG